MSLILDTQRKIIITSFLVIGVMCISVVWYFVFQKDTTSLVEEGSGLEGVSDEESGVIYSSVTLVGTVVEINQAQEDTLQGSRLKLETPSGMVTAFITSESSVEDITEEEIKSGVDLLNETIQTEEAYEFLEGQYLLGNIRRVR